MDVDESQTQNRADFAQGAALPASRRHLEKVAALPTADADHARGADSAGNSGRFALFDEGIADVPLDLDADLVGLTVITGTAMRAYELADHFRQRGIKVVLGGPHVTLIPDDAHRMPMPLSSVTLKIHGRNCCVISRMGNSIRYDQAPGLDLADRPFARRDLLPGNRYLTNNVFEATRGCIHNCDFCVVPTAWGRKPYLETGGRCRGRHSAARRAQTYFR